MGYFDLKFYPLNPGLEVPDSSLEVLDFSLETLDCSLKMLDFSLKNSETHMKKQNYIEIGLRKLPVKIILFINYGGKKLLKNITFYKHGGKTI